MEPMSALDATFVAIEDRTNHMHIGVVALFDGTPPPHDEMLAFVASKLPRIPRYRQKLLITPLALTRPQWTDDTGFRVDHHVYRVGVPAPGGPKELREVVGHLMSLPLDRSRSPWELYVVEGLRDGGWALVTKVHHCMVDGVAGSDLLGVLLDTEPRASRVVPPDEWRPGSDPSLRARAGASLRAAAGLPVRALAAMAGAARSPGDTMREAFETMKLAARLARPAPPSSLTGPIGPRRCWVGARVDLADVKTVRTVFGGTVNDVALALVSAGLRELLLVRGDSIDGRTVRTLVPVSVRAPDARGIFGNRVAALVAELPVGTPDAVARLTSITEQMDRRKHSREVAGTGLALRATELLPSPAAALLERVVAHRQHSVETVSTNVPGPEMPLYLRGREMVAVHPYVPLAGTVQVGIAMFSYRGTLSFGVTGDGDRARDVQVVATGIEQGLRDLVDAAAAVV